jgi:predicted RNase H-like HicB family nuclease
MRDYIAIIHKDPDSDYGVSFPDLPGCITAGSTIEEARDMAAEALGGHLAVMAAHGEPLPAPSTIEAIMRVPDFQDGFPMLVHPIDPDAPAVRVNITMPAEVLKAIDRFAEREGLTRSGLLVRGAQQLMKGGGGAR